MLRGAVTVIGGLYEINDLATTQIMGHFWQEFADGQTPLAALSRAKTHQRGQLPDPPDR